MRKVTRMTPAMLASRDLVADLSDSLAALVCMRAAYWHWSAEIIYCTAKHSNDQWHNVFFAKGSMMSFTWSQATLTLKVDSAMHRQRWRASSLWQAYYVNNSARVFMCVVDMRKCLPSGSRLQCLMPSSIPCKVHCLEILSRCIKLNMWASVQP